MKKENFKIGQTIYYMSSNKPQSGKVTAVLTIEGKVKIDYTNFNVPELEKETVYYVDYSQIKSSEAFGSLEDLKQSLFSEN